MHRSILMRVATSIPSLRAALYAAGVVGEALSVTGCTFRQTGQNHANSPVPSADLVFEGVTVVDVEHGTLQPHQRVVIAGSRIQSLGKEGAEPLPPQARVVDGRGKYLIPGLWDWHVHPMMFPEDAYPSLIAYGITGFREPGTISLDSARKWRREILAGTRVGPPRQILSSLPLHGISAANMAAGKCLSYCIVDAADARHAVDSFKAAGADMLKMYDFVTKSQYFALAAEARRVGIPFGGHVASPDLTAIEASDSGARILDHIEHEGYAAGSVRQCVVPTATIEQCQLLIEHFRRNGTWWVPTLAIFAQVANRFHLSPRPATDTIVKHYANFVRASRQDSTLHFPIDSAGIASLRGSLVDSLGMLRFVRRLKWPLLAGTDATTTGHLFFVAEPGSALHVELAIYVAEGLTPLEALQTATLNAARYLHATDSLGTVAPGKLADLVLLDGDPLTAVTNTQRIRAVVANGRYFDRADLDTQLLVAKRARKALEAVGYDAWEKQRIAPYLMTIKTPEHP